MQGGRRIVTGNNTIIRRQMEMPLVAPFVRRPFIGILFALGAVLLWGSNAVIARFLAQQGVSMSAVAFLRVAIGGGVLGLWMVMTRSAHWRQYRPLLRDRWVWLSLLCYGGNMLVFHWALARTTASAVMLLENIAPIIALFGGAWLFCERITGRSLTALGLALSGVVIVCSEHAGLGAAARAVTMRGNLLALLAGVTWGGYTLASRGLGLRHGGNMLDAMASMVVTLLGSALLLSPFVVGITNWPVSFLAWVWVVVLGVLHTAFATMLWRLALTHISAYTASLLFVLTLVLTMGNAALFLHEPITSRILLGAGGIIAALLLMVNARRTDYAGVPEHTQLREKALDSI